jgi:UDP-3-O-[3-hydroxymyristoyl] N-acetylglucosamine deacetylase
MRMQQTLLRPVAVEGVGYWSGRPNRVELLPARAGSGIVFVRSDLTGCPRVAAAVSSRVPASNRTNLRAEAAEVEMVEHLLSSLSALQVDCCEVRLSAAELPGLDGSAVGFVEAIHAAGVASLGVPVEPLVVRHPVRVAEGEAWVEAEPGAVGVYSVEYSLDYGPGSIPPQSYAIEVTPTSYREQVSAARTFLRLEEAERLQAAGLGRHVSTRELLVFGADGPIDNCLRWSDECARHKVLDIIGDLALVGRPIEGRVRASRSGHGLNAALAAALLAADAFSWGGDG